MKGGTSMKKVFFILACLFLIGCQANDEPVEDDEQQTSEEEQIEDIETDGAIDEDEADVEPDSEPETNDQEDEASEDPIQEEEPEQDESETVTDEKEGYTSDDAIALVQEYIQGTESDIGLNFNFDGLDDDGNYRIQVFEVVDHGGGESHTATYGWYLVDPDTGEITDLFN